jgi:hypothetical protein
MSWAAYANKSLCYNLYLMAIRGKHFRFFAGPTTRTMVEFKDMEEQVLGLTKKFIGIGNTMVCEAADEGGHDDHPDSQALACYAADQAVELDMDQMDTIELSDYSIQPRNPQQDGPITRADSYRSARRGRSRYDVHRSI